MYVREEELESQFQRIFDGFRFPDAFVDWVKEGLRESRHEQEAFHRKAMRKLRAEYDKLENRLGQIYLDKLDGEIAEAFYRRSVKTWRSEQDSI